MARRRISRFCLHSTNLCSMLVRTTAVTAAAALPIGSARAQIAPPGFAAFKHIGWGVEQGAPEGVFETAQTPDGYLWLTGDGLYRFDGATFERIDWPAGAPWKRLDPTSLLVSRRGELWVGLNAKPVLAVYRGGRLVDAGMPRPPGPMAAMAESPDGTMWFAFRRRGNPLRQLRHGRWSSLPLPPGAVMDLVAMQDGSVWVALAHEGGRDGAIAYLPNGASRFQLLPDPIGPLPRLARDAGGALWVSDRAGTRMLIDAAGKRALHPVAVPVPAGIRSAAFAFDRAGGLWRTSGRNGIAYAPHAASASAGPPYAFTAANGLRSDFTYHTMVDREGSVWIATEAGLDQFRRSRAIQESAIPADPVDGLAIARAEDGNVYVASNGALFRIAPGRSPERVLTLDKALLSICPARAGGVWVVQPTRTLRVQESRVALQQRHVSIGAPINCAEDRSGRLWLSDMAAPLRWHDLAWWHDAPGPLRQQHAWEVAATRSGDIAFNGLPRLGILRGNQLTLRGKYGTATMLTTSGDDVFLSDAQGLVRLRGTTIARLDDKRFPWLVWLRGLMQTREGQTWLVARSRIYQVATADLDRAFADPKAPLPYRYFDTQDGLVSAAQHAGFKGTQIVEGGDGRIWFLNREGAAYFDRAALTPNPLPPPVAIRVLRSGTSSWRDPVKLTLPAGTRAVDIGYAGLTFIVPQRMRFRYRLEGIDADWVDAGARRLASYANLGPGTYRFQVIAANADGVWNRTGASLNFDIRPTFWQSTPFKLLCAVALLGLLWGAYALRLRVVAARIRLRMTERFEERERIARELHDTLLQGIQAVTLRFQRVVNELPDQQPARGSLLQALDVADQVIAEGRNRVQDLRSRQHDALAPLLREAAAQQLFEPGVEITIAEHGRRRPIEPLALDEIASIAGETLANIRRHAAASGVEIEVRYGRSLRLRIVDDGVGIDPAVAETGTVGHFGLRGMRERARKLRATLALRPLADHGTELVLTVPGRVAYLPERRSWWARIRRMR
ncbi:sensor histidine kinase [Sphingomonas azotifigens]|uniref:sensor histidine kinase n=1 Tax=Sphingomonas azotifigens TaxID=330920 RepID=UPI0009FF96A5|nr:sensor histidine kinase [Sphingomonas azotifigens]